MTSKSNREEIRKKWAQVVAKAWKDEKFKSKLLSNPTQVLKEHGIEVHENKTFRVIEEGKSEVCLILHALPSESLSEVDLRKIAAAGFYTSPGCG